MDILYNTDYTLVNILQNYGSRFLFGINKNIVTRIGRCIPHIFSNPLLKNFAHIYIHIYIYIYIYIYDIGWSFTIDTNLNLTKAFTLQL